MRPSLPALAAAALLFSAPPAFAAPTCQDQTGAVIRCGVPGAMPVGWTLPPEQRWERDFNAPSGPTPAEQWSLVAVLGGLFALIALMPKFDGWGPGDWDRQEGDEEEE